MGSSPWSNTRNSSPRDLRLQLAEVASVGGDDAEERARARLAALIEAHRADVLFLSTQVTPAVEDVGALRKALVDDPGCATVSLDARGELLAPGIPPPTVRSPRHGAVLARRDHVLLALTETPVADRTGRANDDEAGVVAGLLGRLSRPGFVHRAFRPGAAPSTTGDKVDRRPGTPRGDLVIDGRMLAYPVAGTQVFAIGLLGGLVRAGADPAVALGGELHPSIREELGELANAIRFVAPEAVGRPAIYHKPHQCWSLHDVAEGLATGERFVFTQLDMILERTPAYRPSEAEWLEQRETTDAALASADHVAFLSLQAALDAASDGTVAVDRATVIHCGVDHLARRAIPDPATPFGGRPYLLVVGNAYWHKNRPFALRVLDCLVERYGWDGGLVLVGGYPRDGSSLEAEAQYVTEHAALKERVLDLGHVGDRDRLALMAGAELVLFPSYFEGFGFVPFEAAAVGTACVYAHLSAMRELLPLDGALPSFDVEEAGGFLLRVLEDPAARRRIVDAIDAAGAHLTWDRAAAGYLEVYERSLAVDQRPASRRLLSLVPGPERRLVSRGEVVLVDVYRRRRAFRVGADVAVHGMQAALIGARRLSRLRRERG